MITVCTHPDRCAGMEQAHSDMAAQLLALTTERDRLRAQLAQAQAEAREWQDAYNGMVEGKAFYEGLFCDKCKEVAR